MKDREIIDLWFNSLPIISNDVIPFPPGAKMYIDREPEFFPIPKKQRMPTLKKKSRKPIIWAKIIGLYILFSTFIALACLVDTGSASQAFKTFLTMFFGVGGLIVFIFTICQLIVNLSWEE